MRFRWWREKGGKRRNLRTLPPIALPPELLEAKEADSVCLRQQGYLGAAFATKRRLIRRRELSELDISDSAQWSFSLDTLDRSCPTVSEDAGSFAEPETQPKLAPRHLDIDLALNNLSRGGELDSSRRRRRVASPRKAREAPERLPPSTSARGVAEVGSRLVEERGESDCADLRVHDAVEKVPRYSSTPRVRSTASINENLRKQLKLSARLPEFIDSEIDGAEAAIDSIQVVTCCC